MLIDWFTVGAQVLNFLVLVWLMKRYLYKPILHAIDLRETKIAEELADAQAKKAEAAEDQSTFQKKIKDFDKERDSLMEQATNEANIERKRLLDDAHLASDALRTKRRDALKTEARTLNQAIKQRTQQEVFALSRKALSDLAGISLEERMCDVFVSRLNSIDQETKESIELTFKGEPIGAILRSAFDLPEDQKEELYKVIKAVFDSKIEIKYEIAPELVAGIELSMSGQRVAWSVANYLTTLEKGVDALLNDKGKTDV